MHRVALGLLLVLGLAGTAIAHPPPEEREEPPTTRPTLVEWTTWLRGGIVVGRSAAPEATVARATTPDTPIRDRYTGGAIGAGFTLPIGAHVRVGPWLEFRDWGAPVLGGELTVLPGSLDMFWYKGQSAVTARAGANPDVRTAQLGIAYRAPWDLFGRRPRASRYVIGVGIVATATQNRQDPRDWSATVGLELEPVGAIRYLLGIRSWY